MKSLLNKFDAGTDAAEKKKLKDALNDISDDTINKVFKGKVALTIASGHQKWQKSSSQTHKSLPLGRK